MKKCYVFLLPLCVLFFISACVGHRGHFPRPGGGVRIIAPMPITPPLAPAHGYHHTYHDGAVLSFDSSLGVYLVIGHPGIYFYDDLYFYQHPTGYWQSSRYYRGPWLRAADPRVPMKLRGKRRGRH